MIIIDLIGLDLFLVLFWRDISLAVSRITIGMYSTYSTYLPTTCPLSIIYLSII